VAKKPKKLEDLFHETLKDIYFAENKILKTLPKMAKAAQSKELKAAFVQHERETRGQVSGWTACSRSLANLQGGRLARLSTALQKRGPRS